MRTLERRFGEKHQWLRRPRSIAERAYRRILWSPTPPAAVASLLSSAKRRLVRSEEDAVEGIRAAVTQYEWGLRNASPAGLEDLWNTPANLPASPKAEERISDKLCEAIRDYFRAYAVAAGREVQVFRRSVPTQHGGAPGSEVDVLVSIPSPGTEGSDPISVPVEVKRSDNREAQTGLKEQLVDRYMSQLGTRYGVFIVVWLHAPNLARSHRPVWPSLEQARRSITDQAHEASNSPSCPTHVCGLVVDASLV